MNACTYARRSELIERWLNSIASSTKESDKILVVYNPKSILHRLELPWLDPILSEMLNRKNLDYFPISPGHDLRRDLKSAERKLNLSVEASNEPRNSDEIDAIVILDKNLEQTFLNDSEGWLSPREFRGAVLVGRLKKDRLSRQWNRKE